MGAGSGPCGPKLKGSVHSGGEDVGQDSLQTQQQQQQRQNVQAVEQGLQRAWQGLNDDDDNNDDWDGLGGWNEQRQQRQQQQQQQHLEGAPRLSTEAQPNSSRLRGLRIRRALETGTYKKEEGGGGGVHFWLVTPEDKPATDSLHKHQLSVFGIVDYKEPELHFIDPPGFPEPGLVYMAHRYFAYAFLRPPKLSPSPLQKHDFLIKANKEIAALRSGGARYGPAEALINQMNEYELDEELREAKLRLTQAREMSMFMFHPFFFHGIWLGFRPPVPEPAKQPVTTAVDKWTITLLSLEREACTFNATMAASRHRSAFAARNRGSPQHLFDFIT